MPDPTPSDGTAPTGPSTEAAEESGTVPPMPAEPPAEPPTVKRRPRFRVSAMRPAAALATGIALGTAATGLVWLGTAAATGGERSDGTAGAWRTSAASGRTGPFAVRGTLTLTDRNGYTPLGETCLGKDGYDDITVGTTVTVSDAAGKVVAVGSLDLGEVTESGCSFPFTVEDVPSGPKFYTVEVSHRGGITQAAAEMHDKLSFTLG